MSRLAAEHESAMEAGDNRIDWLRECVSELPLEQRRLIEQCYLQKTSVQDVAVTLNIKPNTLAQRIARIRRRLFDCINLKARTDSQ